MSDFQSAWSLSRSRFVAELEGLSYDQLNWKLYPGSLSIGQAALHVAGVEVRFGRSLLGVESLSPEMERVLHAAGDSIVNDKPFPFEDSEITPEFVARILNETNAFIEPAIADPTADRRGTEFLSVLGPMISGEGAYARLSFHAAYHQGQAYLMRMHPDFPKS